MKALSVRQPYADQIANGKKKKEYRTWKKNYRGPLLIVSSQSPKIKELPSGMAVAIVDLVDCVLLEDYSYAWKLKNVKKIAKPFPIKGKLGIYEVSTADCPRNFKSLLVDI